MEIKIEQNLFQNLFYHNHGLICIDSYLVKYFFVILHD